MQVYRYIRSTQAEGPGTRFALWVQGCSHRCPGCFLKETWDFDKGENIPVSALIAEFEQVMNRIDGVTLLGGEPFDQAQEVAKFSSFVRSVGKTVITFTGYRFSELTERKDSSVGVVLKNTDILIDGRFVEELLDFSRPMVGSSNQTIHFLTDRIPKETFYSYQNRFEVRTDRSGGIRINGMGDIQALRNALGGNHV